MTIFWGGFKRSRYGQRNGLHRVWKFNLQRASNLLQKSKAERLCCCSALGLIARVWHPHLLKDNVSGLFFTILMEEAFFSFSFPVLSFCYLEILIMTFCTIPFVHNLQAKAKKMQWKSNISVNIVFSVSAVSRFVFLVHGMDISVHFRSSKAPNIATVLFLKTPGIQFSDRDWCIIAESFP